MFNVPGGKLKLTFPFTFLLKDLDEIEEFKAQNIN